MLFRPSYTKQVLILSVSSIFASFYFLMVDSNDDLYYSFPKKISILVFSTYLLFVFIIYLFYRFKAFIEIGDSIVISYPFSWGKKPYFIKKENVANIVYDGEKEFYLFEVGKDFLEVDCKLWNDAGNSQEKVKNIISKKIKDWGLTENSPDFFDVDKYKQRFLFNQVNLVFFIGFAIILQAITWEYSCYILPSVKMLDKLVIALSIMIASLTLICYWCREKDGRIFESSYFSILILPFILSLCCAYAIPKYTVFKGNTKDYIYILVSSNESQQLWRGQGIDDLQIKRKYNYDYRDETIGTQRTVVIYQGWGDIKVIKESTVNSFFQK